MAVSRNWANLKSFLRKTYNREVNEWFADEPDPVPDNTTSRKQAKRACLILPKESQNMALLKSLTFRYVVQRVHLRPHVYGIPTDKYQEEVSFRPQVHLYFKQDSGAIPAGKRPVEGQLSFRLMDETSESMTKAKASALALKIKNEFALGTGYIWKKGKYKIVVRDPGNGLSTSILCLNEAEGKEVVNKLYDVIEGTYDEDKVNVVNPGKDSVTNPTGSNLVYGKYKPKKRWRPVANVRFQYATLSLDGLNEAVILVDRSFQYFTALEIV